MMEFHLNGECSFLLSFSPISVCDFFFPYSTTLLCSVLTCSVCDVTVLVAQLHEGLRSCDNGTTAVDEKVVLCPHVCSVHGREFQHEFRKSVTETRL